jgi:hypothetical protein
MKLTPVYEVLDRRHGCNESAEVRKMGGLILRDRIRISSVSYSPWTGSKSEMAVTMLAANPLQPGGADNGVSNRFRPTRPM